MNVWWEKSQDCVLLYPLKKSVQVFTPAAETVILLGIRAVSKSFTKTK